MKTFLRFIGVMSAAVFASQAMADTSFNVSDLSGVTQSMVHDLVGVAAVSTSHRAYMPASGLGWNIGLDIGIEATGVKLPASFRSAIATASQKSTSDIPGVIPVPKLNLHKGLPFGIDLGLSYISYSDKIKVIGGESKWAFTDLIPESPLSGALRLSYTSEKLWYLSSSNFQMDVLASQQLLFLEPYIGAGLQFWSGHIEVPTNLPANLGLPASVSGNDSGTNTHFFAGVPMKLAAFWLTPEVDYSTVGVFSFGSKFSLNF